MTRTRNAEVGYDKDQKCRPAHSMQSIERAEQMFQGSRRLYSAFFRLCKKRKMPMLSSPFRFKLGVRAIATKIGSDGRSCTCVSLVGLPLGVREGVPDAGRAAPLGGGPLHLIRSTSSTEPEGGLVWLLLLLPTSTQPPQLSNTGGLCSSLTHPLKVQLPCVS